MRSWRLRAVSLTGVALLAMLFVLSGWYADVVRACDATGSDAGAMRRARHAVRRGCGCDGPSRDAFLTCARGVIDRRIDGGLLPASCRRSGFRTARESTCGRPGAVVCCRTDSTGSLDVSIVKPASACVALNGGTACISGGHTVAEGCHGRGGTCDAVCGDGKIETGEECDGETFCSDCKIIVRACCPFGDSKHTCIERLYSPSGAESFPTDCPTARGGVARVGALCSDDGQSCMPDPAATDLRDASICCENRRGCADPAFRTTNCFMTDPGVLLVVGSCGVDGHCRAR